MFLSRWAIGLSICSSLSRTFFAENDQISSRVPQGDIEAPAKNSGVQRERAGARVCVYVSTFSRTAEVNVYIHGEHGCISLTSLIIPSSSYLTVLIPERLNHMPVSVDFSHKPATAKPKASLSHPHALISTPLAVRTLLPGPKNTAS